MRIRSLSLLVTSLVVAACSAREPGPLRTGPGPHGGGRGLAPAPVPGLPSAMAETQPAPVLRRGRPLGGRFDTQRQIAELKRAVALYTQFVERAEGRPELASAVKKSRERRADARDTVVFLEQSLREDAER